MNANLTVFAVEDTTAQFTWRGLRAGTLRIQAADTLITCEVTDPAGAVVLGDLPPGTDLVAHASGTSLPDGPIDVPLRTLDALPGAELCRIATISDLHLGTTAFGHRGTIRERPRPEVPHPIRCAEAAIDEAVAWGAQRLVVKGDITDHGQVDQWRSYARLIRGLPIPVDALPGNHDRAFKPSDPGLLPEEAADAFGLSMAAPITVRDHPGLRLILLDTTTPLRNQGSLARVRELTFAAVAETDRDRAVIIAHHQQLHPHIVAEGLPVGIDLAQSRAFLEALSRLHPYVLTTSGHTHRHRRWSHAGVTTTQVGSTKDYPGVWAGYVVHEGGLRQLVRRVGRPDCVRWTDHTRRAAGGAWRWIAPGRLADRCFSLTRVPGWGHPV